MKTKNVILLILVMILALAVLGFSFWFDRNGQHAQISADTATPPTTTENSYDDPTEPSDAVSEESTDPTDTKVPAPDFTVYDLDGNEVHLSDFLGKPVVLNFWASWCGPCKNEMPAFHWKYKEYEGQVQFLMINLTDGSKETVESAFDFITQKGYTFPVYYDRDYDAANAYGIQSIPTTFFIDAEGYAVAQATGSIDSETLQKGIDMILPEEQPEEDEETETE